MNPLIIVNSWQGIEAAENLPPPVENWNASQPLPPIAEGMLAWGNEGL